MNKDIDQLNRNQLLHLCQELNIEKYKSKTKQQLVDLLKNKYSSNSSMSIITKNPLKPLVKWSG